MTPPQKLQLLELTGRQMDFVDIPDEEGSFRARMPHVAPEEVFAFARRHAEEMNRWEEDWATYQEKLAAWRREHPPSENLLNHDLASGSLQQHLSGLHRSVSEALSAPSAPRLQRGGPPLRLDEREIVERGEGLPLPSAALPFGGPSDDDTMISDIIEEVPDWDDDEPTQRRFPDAVALLAAGPPSPASERSRPPGPPPGDTPPVAVAAEPSVAETPLPATAGGSGSLVTPAPSVRLPPQLEDTPLPSIDLLEPVDTRPDSPPPRLFSGPGLSDRLGVGSCIDDRYEILEKLGTGGYATVFKARQLHIDRLVAVKVLKVSLQLLEDDSFETRFVHEAQIAARINHPNVVIIHDFGFAGPLQQPFIAMELIEGHDLREELERNGPMAADRAIPLIQACLEALGAGHESGIVHKDIKPSNLYLTSSDKLGERIKILDFGIARQFSSDSPRLTATGDMIGTPQYVAPEYARSQIVSPALDVYQMGLILVEMLSGERAADSSSRLECILQHSSGKLNIPAWLLDSSLGTIISRALVVDYEQRYPDAWQFRDALVKLDPVKLQAELDKARRSAMDPSGQSTRTFLGVFVVVLLAALLTGLFLLVWA